MSTTQTYHCCNCMLDFLHDDAAFVQVDDNPPDWQVRCPECGSSGIRETVTAICERCEAEPVPDEGELCAECVAVTLEAQADKATGR